MHNIISQLRRELGYSQTKFAKKVQISRNHLSRIENEKTDPTGSIMFKIAKALNKSVDEVFSPVCNACITN